PARYCDPGTARFLSPDPAPPAAGDPLSLNRYTYCAGDPVNSSDPTGAVTDVEWGAWDYYYNHDSASKGDRIDAADRTAQTHAGVNTRRAEAAAREAQARAAAMREREMQGIGDYAAMLALSVSRDDLQTMRNEGLSGKGGQVAFVTLISQPGVSWILAGAGAYMVAVGAHAVVAGSLAAMTGVGLPAGAIGIAGGLVLVAVGAGLVWAGGTAAEVQTGIDIPLCGR
ncbi:MAG TPA: RHS repeat-associated core domain-containing protein, partial [Coriobacteriia bacterium]|nr:RHS repeat-associated core domain-containing protein [Coriobacteriia bacterium]